MVSLKCSTLWLNGDHLYHSLRLPANQAELMGLDWAQFEPPDSMENFGSITNFISHPGSLRINVQQK